MINSAKVAEELKNEGGWVDDQNPFRFFTHLLLSRRFLFFSVSLTAGLEQANGSRDIAQYQSVKCQLKQTKW